MSHQHYDLSDDKILDEDFLRRVDLSVVPDVSVIPESQPAQNNFFPEEGKRRLHALLELKKPTPSPRFEATTPSINNNMCTAGTQGSSASLFGVASPEDEAKALLKFLATNLRKAQMERVKTIVTSHNLQSLLQESRTPKGCTISTPLGLPEPIDPEIQTQWQAAQNQCSIELTKILFNHHNGLEQQILQKAKGLADQAHNDIVLKYRETVPSIEQQLLDLTTFIRNDAERAILNRINKKARPVEDETRLPAQKRPKNPSTPSKRRERCHQHPYR